MQEYSDGANQPMLPVVPGDDCDALYLLLVAFYEPGMLFESRNIFPAVELGSIIQQSDLPVLTDQRIDLQSNLAEVVSFQFTWRDDPQRVGGDDFCPDHAKPPSWSKQL
jgi:hypothetical protein